MLVPRGSTKTDWEVELAVVIGRELRYAADHEEALAAVAGLPGGVEAGIALHYGEAAYGNVGSGQRLDFTAVGRDVNVASRLARLNKTLGEPLLVSRAFAARAGIEALSLGAFEADGLPEPLEALRPGRA